MGAEGKRGRVDAGEAMMRCGREGGMAVCDTGVGVVEFF